MTKNLKVNVNYTIMVSLFKKLKNIATQRVVRSPKTEKGDSPNFHLSLHPCILYKTHMLKYLAQHSQIYLFLSISCFAATVKAFTISSIALRKT